MTGNFAWRHQNCIESAISDRFIRICRQPNLRRSRNPTALPLVDRFGGLLEARARLYLYEDQQLTPARHDIDFTDRAAPAPRQNSKALAIRKAAARLSAEIPTRNAACRSGRGRRFDGERGSSLAVISHIPGEIERTLIDLAARTSGDKGNFAHCVLDRNAPQRLT